jgi:hypothetical protein
MIPSVQLQQGVNPSRVKPLPLQANIDLLTYSAKQEMSKVSLTITTKELRLLFCFNTSLS